MPILCDVCGGPLMIAAGGVAVCKNCGMEHSIERVREKMSVGMPPAEDTPQAASTQPSKPAPAAPKPAVPEPAMPEAGQAEGTAAVDSALLKKWEKLGSEDPKRYEVQFGEHGLSAAETGVLTQQQLETVREILVRHKKGLRGAKIWVRVFPSYQYKGNWIEVVKPGKVLFEVSGMPQEVVLQCLTEAEGQLPFRLCLSGQEGTREEPEDPQKVQAQLVGTMQTPAHDLINVLDAVAEREPEEAEPVYLVLQDICKEAEGKPVIHNLSLRVRRGTKVTFTGCEGDGSLLLRMIAGLEPVTSGEMYRDGVLLNPLEPVQRSVELVTGGVIYCHMTVYENLAYALKLRQTLSQEQIDQRVRWAAGLLGITDVLEQKDTLLTEEQKLRCAIAKVIAGDKELLLMNEPFAKLDKASAVSLCADLERLRPYLGTILLVVKNTKQANYWIGNSNDIVVCGRLSDRVIDPFGNGSEQDEILNAEWTAL